MDHEEVPRTDDDPVEHLWNAAHEMLRAMRRLVDAADEFVEQQRGRPRREHEARLHRIDIDER
jgi:hypothetical protein